MCARLALEEAGNGEPLVLLHGIDICELADALCLDRFSVVGVSAGGPYARRSRTNYVDVSAASRSAVHSRR
jgi:hypothetical protein